MVTIFPVHQELFRIVTDNSWFKSGERESHKIMDYMVDIGINTAAQFQRAAWIGTIFRTCRRSREESITCSFPGMDD